MKKIKTESKRQAGSSNAKGGGSPSAVRGQNLARPGAPEAAASSPKGCDTASHDQLQRADVEEYLRLHAQKATCEKRLTELREAILPHLAAGAATPNDLPYRLVRRLRHDLLKDYREPLLECAEEMFRLLHFPLTWKEKALAYVKGVEAGFSMRETVTLCVEINKEYAAQL